MLTNVQPTPIHAIIMLRAITRLDPITVLVMLVTLEMDRRAVVNNDIFCWLFLCDFAFIIKNRALIVKLICVSCLIEMKERNNLI